jgi:hypothetical protein
MTNAEIIAIVRRAKFKLLRGGKSVTSDNKNRPKLRAIAGGARCLPRPGLAVPGRPGGGPGLPLGIEVGVVIYIRTSCSRHGACTLPSMEPHSGELTPASRTDNNYLHATAPSPVARTRIQRWALPISLAAGSLSFQLAPEIKGKAPFLFK